MHLNISIVTYKTNRLQLKKAIDCVITESACINKIYIIDNSPTNQINKAPFLNEKVEYLFNDRNLGYGKAHNIALQKSLERGTLYHLVVNPDISFEPNVLSQLKQFMDQNTDVGLCMPKILYPDGQIQRLCKLLPTPGHLIARRFFSFMAKELDFKYQLEFADYDVPFECPSLSGCFMFLRMKALQKIGFFDERFFMYFEDVDLVRRIGQHYKTMYWPAVSVIHHYEKGSYSNKKLLLAHMESAIKYFNKWGWFFDARRKQLNCQTISRIKEQMSQLVGKG